jgi:hypothetical protein
MEEPGLARPARPRQAEPSWPKVIATTVRLWWQRHARARRVLVAGVLTAAAAGTAGTVVALHGAAAAGSPRPAAARAAAPSAQAVASLQAAQQVRQHAAEWIARQVSTDAIVSCDPVMCATLESGGVPASRLLVLGVQSPDPLGSDVIVATPAVRTEFGSRLGSVYAPVVIASFGSGSGRIDVRAVAPDGSAAYLAALAGDRRARVAAGRQVLRNRGISVSASARKDLLAGRVDPRLLITLVALAAQQPVHVASFGDPSPGAASGIPLRGVQITPGRPARRLAELERMMSFFRAQQVPFVPARIKAGGGFTLNVQYDAPSPLGLLTGTQLPGGPVTAAHAKRGPVRKLAWPRVVPA